MTHDIVLSQHEKVLMTHYTVYFSESKTAELSMKKRKISFNFELNSKNARILETGNL